MSNDGADEAGAARFEQTRERYEEADVRPGICASTARTA